MLTLSWSDGATFVTIDFALLSSTKKENRYTEAIDKRTVGYKRRKEAVKQTPEAVIGLLRNALLAGVQASHVLTDSVYPSSPPARTPSRGALCHRHGEGDETAVSMGR